MNAYHIRGLSWKPRTKADFINMIMATHIAMNGAYTGTVTALMNKDIKELKAIYKDIQQQSITILMRKKSAETS